MTSVQSYTAEPHGESVSNLGQRLAKRSWHFSDPPRTVTDKLRRVLNTAARVVTGSWKFDRGLGQILHDELWLDVPDRVFFKLAVTVHRCLNDCAPPYLSDYCVPVADADTGSTCVPPTVNYLQYLATGSTLTAVWPFQMPAPLPRTISWISSETRPSVQTVSDVCLKRTCLLILVHSAR